MKVFLVSNMYPSVENPRYGIFVKRFEDEMSSRGIKFSRAIMTAKYEKPILIKLFSYLQLYYRILEKGLTSNYKMIYVHFPSHVAPALIILRFFRRKPMILNFHGVDAFIQTREQKIFRLFLKPLIPNTKLFVVPSDYYRSVISKEFGVAREDIYVYPSGGIDKSIFKPLEDNKIQKLKNSLKINQETFVFGFVSSFIKEKGWFLFVDLIDHFSKSGKAIKGIMIGGGKEAKDVDNRIVELNLQDKITILDAIKQDSLPLYYNVMDVFVFPTISKTESLGLVGLEALACGIPVIASNIGGPSGYIKEDYNGMLFEPNGLDGLIKKTNKYINLDHKSKLSLKQNATKSVSKYDKLKVNKELYENLIRFDV